MALKLSFRFQRENYSPGEMRNSMERYKQRLKDIFDNKGITYSHIYDPTRNAIKAIFPTEKELDKALANEEAFKAQNFTPKMSLEMKASRTIFCSNLDPTILQNNSKEEIKESLQQQGWKIKDVYIMKSKKSFKIEMEDRKMAKDFLTKDTHINNVILPEDSKEPETDPTVNQCWDCGE